MSVGTVCILYRMELFLFLEFHCDIYNRKMHNNRQLILIGIEVFYWLLWV